MVCLHSVRKNRINRLIIYLIKLITHDLFCCPVEGCYPFAAIYRKYAAVYICHNIVINGLKLLKVNLLLFKLFLYLDSPFRKIACQECNGKKTYNIQHNSSQDISPVISDAAWYNEFVTCWKYLIKIKVYQNSVCNAACGCSIKSAPAVKEYTGAYYGQEIEKRQYAFHAACHIHRGGDKQDVHEYLEICKQFCIFNPSEKVRIQDCQETGDYYNGVYGVKDRLKSQNLFELQPDRCAEEYNDKSHPEDHQPFKSGHQSGI